MLGGCVYLFVMFLIVGFSFQSYHYIEAGSIRQGIAKLFAVLMFLIIIIDSIIMTVKFDKFFKEKLIRLMAEDAKSQVAPMFSGWLTKMRLYRGALYIGGVLFYCLPIDPLFDAQKLLIEDSRFVDNLSAIDVFFPFLIFTLFLLALIFGAIPWLISSF